MSQEADKEFIRNFIYVLVALAVSGIIFAILGNKIAGNVTDPAARAALRTQLRTELSQPVSRVSTVNESGLLATTEGASDAPSGQQVIKPICSACDASEAMHARLGAPQISNKNQWVATAS